MKKCFLLDLKKKLAGNIANEKYKSSLYSLQKVWSISPVNYGRVKEEKKNFIKTYNFQLKILLEWREVNRNIELWT